MPAIRRKDRCGPGMRKCDEAECVESSGEEVTAASECVGRVARGRSPLPANKSEFKSKNAIRTDNPREDFTAGPSRSWPDLISPGIYRGRQGVSSTREPKTYSDLGLTSTRPYSNGSLGKIPHLEQQSKRFF